MPVYVYGCTDKSHQEREVVHGFYDEPVVACAVCGEVMHRIPQRMRFYVKPLDVLLDKYDRKWREMRTKRH